MRQKKMLRCLVPLLGLALLAIFAALYTVDPKVYYQALVTIGVPAFTYPFIDWEYIGAGIKCWSEGINVYITNPCDLLNRPHNYSPIWLRAVFISTERSWTMPSGLGFVLAFLISLFWLVKPENWRELIIFALACTSPMAIYALERGNVDVIIFIMLIVAGVLSTGPLASRIPSYAVILLAGLLKFYPLVVLSVALRERPRTFVAIAATAGLIIIGFFYRFREELAAVWKNIPPAIFGFGSANLPFDGPLRALRLFPWLEQFAWFRALPYAILTVLLIITAVQVIHLALNRNLVSAFAKTPQRDAMFLVIGAALIAGCFFAGRSEQYRGVHLILIVTGLVAMRRVADNPATRVTLTQAVMIVAFLMWEPFFSHVLHPEQPGLAYGFYWMIREVLWWRLAALLLAMLAIFSVKSQLFAAIQQRHGLFRGNKSIPGDKIAQL
jgi:hypothetical protein